MTPFSINILMYTREKTAVVLFVFLNFFESFARNALGTLKNLMTLDAIVKRYHLKFHFCLFIVGI